jgi:valyl-tRNA synthetase
MEIVCPPLTAATEKLHLGNLYTWMLIDTYKKAGQLRGVDIVARESWNCYSQKLEEKVKLENPRFDRERIIEECYGEVEKNISSAHAIFRRYHINFDKPIIKDDSNEFLRFINEEISRKEMLKRINNGRLELPPKKKVLEHARAIHWTPADIWKRYYGLSTLERVEEIPVFREGSYGIPFDGKVLGQRFVQSMLPEFYSFLGIPTINLVICGNDILTKWIYFMIANSEFTPFDRVGLSGLVLGKNKRKLSKYDSQINTIAEIKDHPDNVRLGLLRQSFGKDFVHPDFSQEEKLRTKALNCLAFFKGYTSQNEEHKFDVGSIKRASLEIAQDIRNLDFQKAYLNFRKFVYDTISKGVIPRIRLNGIDRDSFKEVTSDFKRVANIFIPTTINKE